MEEIAINENTLYFWDYSAQNTTGIWEHLPVRAHGKFVRKATETSIEKLSFTWHLLWTKL